MEDVSFFPLLSSLFLLQTGTYQKLKTQAMEDVSFFLLLSSLFLLQLKTQAMEDVSFFLLPSFLFLLPFSLQQSPQVFSQLCNKPFISIIMLPLR
ncbi:MAG: hypothetical protein F6K48_01555 [Okeania sp. SIO3H1]|nr:hypothetical protein [Okeania sp. SIO3H1]